MGTRTADGARPVDQSASGDTPGGIKGTQTNVQFQEDDKRVAYLESLAIALGVDESVASERVASLMERKLSLASLVSDKSRKDNSHAGEIQELGQEFLKDGRDLPTLDYTIGSRLISLLIQDTESDHFSDLDNWVGRWTDSNGTADRFNEELKKRLPAERITPKNYDWLFEGEFPTDNSTLSPTRYLGPEGELYRISDRMAHKLEVEIASAGYRISSLSSTELGSLMRSIAREKLGFPPKDPKYEYNAFPFPSAPEFSVLEEKKHGYRIVIPTSVLDHFEQITGKTVERTSESVKPDKAILPEHLDACVRALS